MPRGVSGRVIDSVVRYTIRSQIHEPAAELCPAVQADSPFPPGIRQYATVFAKSCTESGLPASVHSGDDQCPGTRSARRGRGTCGPIAPGKRRRKPGVERVLSKLYKTSADAALSGRTRVVVCSGEGCKYLFARGRWCYRVFGRVNGQGQSSLPDRTSLVHIRQRQTSAARTLATLRRKTRFQPFEYRSLTVSARDQVLCYQ